MRKSLNVFLALLLIVSALILWFLTRKPYIPAVLALMAALVVTAALMSNWLKVSLHAAFATFSTALLRPIKLAVFVGVLVTAGVTWSRLALVRHVAADLIAGLLLGAAAGASSQLWFG